MTFKYICPKCGHVNTREYPATRIVCDKCLCVFKPSLSEGLTGKLTLDRVPLLIERRGVNMRSFSKISSVERRILNRGPGC